MYPCESNVVLITTNHLNIQLICNCQFLSKKGQNPLMQNGVLTKHKTRKHEEKYTTIKTCLPWCQA